MNRPNTESIKQMDDYELWNIIYQFEEYCDELEKYCNVLRKSFEKATTEILHHEEWKYNYYCSFISTYSYDCEKPTLYDIRERIIGESKIYE